MPGGSVVQWYDVVLAKLETGMTSYDKYIFLDLIIIMVGRRSVVEEGRSAEKVLLSIKYQFLKRRIFTRHQPNKNENLHEKEQMPSASDLSP